MEIDRRIKNVQEIDDVIAKEAEVNWRNVWNILFAERRITQGQSL